MTKPKLKTAISNAIIIAHRENTSQLENALRQEGLPAKVYRRAYEEDEYKLPSASRCLLNHADAWKNAASCDGLTLIVEADFVPCQGLGDFPLPFTPCQTEKQAAWIYSIGPVIYHYDGNGSFFGHNAGLVAYVLDQASALAWIDLFEEHKAVNGLIEYCQFDVTMPVDLRWKKGVRCYISKKSYGEHGGIANPEHQRHGYRGWHQADTLMAPLRFLPLYAKGNTFLYKATRARSRLRYIYKFIAGKYFDGWPAFARSKHFRRKKLLFAFGRIL